MKSLVALIIVVLAAAGMLGSIWVIMHHRWPNHQIRAEVAGLTASDVTQIDVSTSIRKTIVTDPAEIGKFIQAFRLADQPRGRYDKTLTVMFRLAGTRPNLEYTCGKDSIESDLGPAIAEVLKPYVE